MFQEELKRVGGALNEGGPIMLAMLPGKHLLSLLRDVLGFDSVSDLTGLVLRSLNRKGLKANDPVRSLGVRLETAFSPYLPAICWAA